MSDTETTGTGREWANSFGCEIVNPTECVKQGKLSLRHGLPFIVCGDTGVGKSDLVFDIYAEMRRMVRSGLFSYTASIPPTHPLVVSAYRAAQKDRAAKGFRVEDAKIEFRNWCPAVRDAFSFEGLPYMEVITIDGEKVRRQCYAQSDMIPWDPHAVGIINIREMNRPAAERTLRPIIEALESRMCGEHVIPEGFRIFADINVGDAYDVVDLFNPFFNRRVITVFLQNSLEDWLEYMDARYPNSPISEFLREVPELYDNHEARVNKGIYACAASWTKVHQFLDAEVFNGPSTLEDVRHTLSGLVRKEAANRLIEHIGRGQKLSPSKILEDYSEMRVQVLDYIEDGSGGDIVAAAATAAIRILKSLKPDSPGLDEKISNFCEFYCDLPLEVAQNTALELAPPSNRMHLKDGETRRPENQETVELIKKKLMFHPKAHERLGLLNQIISKRSPSGAKK